MAELDERLSHLISDEDSMKRVLELASAVIAGQNGSSSQEPSQKSPKQTGDATPLSAAPDLTSVLSFLGSSISDTNQQNDSSSSPTAGLIELLPQLLQALSGNTSSLQSDRVNLIRAMQPYMSETRAGSIERAVRMANLTKVAKDFLKLMGR